MPLCDNVPEGEPGWKKIHCPMCGRMCWWQTQNIGVMYHSRLDGAACTECSIKVANTGKVDGEIIPDLTPRPTSNEKLHGKVVGTRMDPYYDVTIYEDGYEKRYYVGD